MNHPRFGTDGWRGLIAEEFTFSNLELVAQATAEHWLRHRPEGTHPLVVVGYDRRFLSGQFAARAAEVLAGNGLKVILTPAPTATPAVSLAVRDLHAAGGVIITASHNPAHFNGFKLKASFGGSADPATCAAIEDRIGKNPVQRLPLKEARRERRIAARDLSSAHLEQIRRLVDFDRLRASRLKIAHDAMYGVGAGLFDAFVEGTPNQLTTLRGEHDPLFGGINPEPIPRYYGWTIDWLKRNPQDICLVTDGDADRLGALDGKGRSLTTHQVISLLIQHFVANRGERGRVVKSVNTTSMVDCLCAYHGLELKQVGIGFKYICAEMRDSAVLLGVEESGGIGYPAYLPERDGIAAGLWLIELLATRGRTVGQLLGELERRFGPHRYDRTEFRIHDVDPDKIEARLKTNPPDRLLGTPVVEVCSFDGVKLIDRDGAWLMFRRSGTEPVFRIYAEARTDRKVERLLALGRRILRTP